MGRVTGKVAFITGAARGQGRSHALTLAREGASIIAVDLCEDIESAGFPQGSEADLAETAKLVEELGARVVTSRADVRSREQLSEAMAAGVAELGRIDVVCANAAIISIGNQDIRAWIDVVDVDLVGVINTFHVALAHVNEGASLIATGSLAAFLPHALSTPELGPGSPAYSFSKRMVAAFVHEIGRQLAPRSIRVNAVHPTNVDTEMLHNEGTYRAFCPDIRHPTRDDAEPRFSALSAMGVPYVDAIDISNAVLFLASDESRYVTGMQLRVDAGGYLNHHPRL